MSNSVRWPVPRQGQLRSRSVVYLPTPVAAPTAYELDCQPGSFTITGTAATLARGLFLDSQPGTFAITGTAATILADRMINAASGSFTLTGSDAELLLTQFSPKLRTLRSNLRH